ncbi:hypothetical protein H920_14725 [Fukomys damarensis]|uniref:Uncharacterized protein n=1 Tax=Fukomys damarensis TaxID=885580 RepID=A0A091CYX1_FUKDA|nr:hypothetical protein H920_19887 [Fukomys damarensis]KFO23927.1 hypothetical protein H920_14725 [Fukomys damarensis]
MINDVIERVKALKHMDVLDRDELGYKRPRNLTSRRAPHGDSRRLAEHAAGRAQQSSDRDPRPEHVAPSNLTSETPRRTATTDQVVLS